MVYPIKSLDGVSVEQAELTARGGIKGDREYALQDREGRWINGKRRPALMTLRARFALAEGRVELEAPGAGRASFVLPEEGEALSAWVGAWLGEPVLLRHQPDGGFPDDASAPGPTLIATATLEEVARWRPGWDLEGARRRFRTNIEVDAPEPFWEDRCYGPAGGPSVVVQLGAVTLLGSNPCARCRVPARDPETGELDEGFESEFRGRRQAGLPPWAERARFDHFYRLAVNTRPAAGQAGRVLRVGDQVTTALTDA